MKKLVLVILIIPLVIFGQVKVGPLTFMDSKSAVNTAFELGIGGNTAVGLSFEVPPYGQLEVLQFIPGFCMKASLGTAGGFFFQNALCARAKYDEKLLILAGYGLGVRLGDNMTVYTPLVVGADYFINEKIMVTGSLQFGALSTLNIGIGMGWGY
ncbi:MAG: hypothetical protein ABIA75_13295 [Candidatus Neomarinimicrobiota bacterium]